MIRKVAVVALAAVGVSGCTSVNVVKPQGSALDAYKAQPLTVVTYEEPSFVATTAGGAAFGLIGALANVSAGEKLVADNHVADPSNAIAEKIAADLKARLHTTDGPRFKERKRGDDAPAKVAKLGGTDGLVLDAQTLGWQFRYFPLDWTHYTVDLSVRVRLIDAGSGKLLGQVPCTKTSNDEKTAASYDDLVANQARLLKQKLSENADACTVLIEQAILPQ